MQTRSLKYVMKKKQGVELWDLDNREREREGGGGEKSGKGRVK